MKRGNYRYLVGLVCMAAATACIRTWIFWPWFILGIVELAGSFGPDSGKPDA